MAPRVLLISWIALNSYWQRRIVDTVQNITVSVALLGVTQEILRSAHTAVFMCFV